jgi:hypothetical protein
MHWNKFQAEWYLNVKWSSQNYTNIWTNIDAILNTKPQTELTEEMGLAIDLFHCLHPEANLTRAGPVALEAVSPWGSRLAAE